MTNEHPAPTDVGSDTDVVSIAPVLKFEAEEPPPADIRPTLDSELTTSSVSITVVPATTKASTTTTALTTTVAPTTTTMATTTTLDEVGRVCRAFEQVLAENGNGGFDNFQILYGDVVRQYIGTDAIAVWSSDGYHYVGYRFDYDGTTSGFDHIGGYADVALDPAAAPIFWNSVGEGLACNS